MAPYSLVDMYQRLRRRRSILPPSSAPLKMETLGYPCQNTRCHDLEGHNLNMKMDTGTWTEEGGPAVTILNVFHRHRFESGQGTQTTEVLWFSQSFQENVGRSSSINKAMTTSASFPVYYAPPSKRSTLCSWSYYQRR